MSEDAPLLPLPEKYRPTTFGDLVGQDRVARYLATLISQGRVNRNLIFAGPFGSGKTTGARLYARALNCESPTEQGDPCNICAACVAHRNDEYAETLEFDGATAGRIENIRQLVDVAKQPPLHGQFRVIQLEEAQGLSNQAWDVLLKLIEEPPPFLVFLFTTTELEKVRPAIRSRCQILEVRTLTDEQSVGLLEKTCRSERWEFEASALKTLATLSNGHSRDLLKNLEQVSWLGGITDANVRMTFNLDHLSALPDLMKAFAEERFSEVRDVMLGWGSDPASGHKQVQRYILYLYYRYVISMPMTVDPTFASLDPAKDQAAVDAWTLLTKRSMNGLTGALQEVLRFSTQFRVTTLTAWEVWAVVVHNFLHHQQAATGSLGKPLDGTATNAAVAPVTRRVRRERVGMVGTESHPQPEVSQPVQEPVPDHGPLVAEDVQGVVPGQWNLAGFRQEV